MVDKLAGTRFLAVVGTSGSGKSSLVNCGLRPALHQGLMARAGGAWRMAQFRPGNDPIGAMARALAKDGVLFPEHAAAGMTLAEIVETTLRMSKLGLIDICEQAALDEGVNLLVVVDQFEELFRYRQLEGRPARGRPPHSRGSRCVREPAAGGQGAGDLPDLHRPDDALGLPRRLHPVSRPGRGHQRRAVPGAATDPGRAPRRHRGSGSGWEARRSRRSC